MRRQGRWPDGAIPIGTLTPRWSKAAAGSARAGQGEETRASRCARDDRGPCDRQYLLGQNRGAPTSSGIATLKPVAAWPKLCSQRFRSRPEHWKGRPCNGCRHVALQDQDCHCAGQGGPLEGDLSRLRGCDRARWSNCCKAVWPRGIMDRVCREGDGLFPSPDEIKLSAAARTGQTCASTSRAGALWRWRQTGRKA